MIYTNEQIDKIAVAANVASRTLEYIKPYVQSGVTTATLDQLCHNFIIENNGIPTSLGYKDFPKSVCISPNHIACHGVPGDRVLKKGDIVNIDVAVTVDGYIGDTSMMYLIGEPSIQAKRVTEFCHRALYAGIKSVKVGEDINVIGDAIAEVIDNTEMLVLSKFCGHGVGVKFHEKPIIFHHKTQPRGIKFKPGMVFTIEPILCIGKIDFTTLSDKWTAVMKNHKPAAQWEHTIAIRENGDVQVLSQRSDEQIF